MRAEVDGGVLEAASGRPPAKSASFVLCEARTSLPPTAPSISLAPLPPRGGSIQVRDPNHSLETTQASNSKAASRQMYASFPLQRGKWARRGTSRGRWGCEPAPSSQQPAASRKRELRPFRSTHIPTRPSDQVPGRTATYWHPHPYPQRRQEPPPPLAGHFPQRRASPSLGRKPLAPPPPRGGSMQVRAPATAWRQCGVQHQHRLSQMCASFPLPRGKWARRGTSRGRWGCLASCQRPAASRQRENKLRPLRSTRIPTPNGAKHQLGATSPSRGKHSGERPPP